MIEQDVVRAIEHVSDLAGKVYPLFVPKSETLPFCVYVSDGAEEDDALSGWIGSYETNMEIHIVHSSYASLKSLTDLVVNELKQIDTATVYIEENQPETYESEINAYRKVISLKLTY